MSIAQWRDTSWLLPGETITMLWPAEFEEPGSFFAEERSVKIEGTSHHRLVLSFDDEGGAVSRFIFASPREVDVRVLGPGARRVSMLPTVLVELTGAACGRRRFLVNETIALYLPRWSAGAAAQPIHDVRRFPSAPAPVHEPMPEEQISLPCPNCGSPLGSPRGFTVMVCGHCRAQQAIPADIAAREQHLRAWLEKARKALDLFTDEQALRLVALERDAWSSATVLAATPLMLMLLAFLAIPLTVVAFQRGESFGEVFLVFSVVWGPVGSLIGIVSGMVFLRKRAQKVYQRDLRSLLVAVPKEHGAPARCRVCGAGLLATLAFCSCRYCGATNVVTAAVASSLGGQHARRALFFDAQAFEARARERAHIATAVQAVKTGHSLGTLVVGPVLGLIIALALAGVHALVE